MEIFQSSQKKLFLNEVINFTRKRFSDNFFNLKIILPSGLLCTNLQQLFIKNLKAFRKDINVKNNNQIIKKLINTKKVRKKILLLKQDINKPDFGRF